MATEYNYQWSHTCQAFTNMDVKHKTNSHKLNIAQKAAK